LRAAAPVRVFGGQEFQASYRELCSPHCGAVREDSYYSHNNTYYNYKDCQAHRGRDRDGTGARLR